MVQAANLGNGDDLASIRTLCRAPVWAILGEREVCPGSVVVVHIGRENAPQVSLVEDDCVIQIFLADRADEALDVGILPGGSRCGDDLLKTHHPDALPESVTIRSVPVTTTAQRVSDPRHGYS